MSWNGWNPGSVRSLNPSALQAGLRIMLAILLFPCYRESDVSIVTTLIGDVIMIGCKIACIAIPVFISEAVTDFLNYYSTDPDDGELNFLIGSCYMNLEKEADAKPYLLKALNGTSYLPETNFYLGSISMDEEDYEAAIPYFTAAIEGDCFTDFSSYNRGVCYLHTDQAEEAVSDFQYAVDHTTDPQLLSDSQNILDQITPKS